MRFRTAVVIGKFYPPHRGHHLLIDTAIANADAVTVIVCERPTDTIPAAARAAWLRLAHPTARVLVIDDRYDEKDSRVWAENTIRWLGAAPDAVFTSEDYGDAYATYMGSKHVPVDKARVNVPCSGTAIRRDPFAHWDFLSPPVRGWFAKRVCVLGAESTGTTTLAQDLAAALGTVWVAEYGREYSALKYAAGDTTWRTDEFVPIAAEQARREDAAACQANRVLVCDTNAFATAVWHRRYVGTDEPRVRAIAAAGRCDLDLLTGDEIPFVQDGLRDGEAIRHAMHGWFEEELAKQAVPWELLRGGRGARLARALELVRGLFAASAWKPGRNTDHVTSNVNST